VISILVARILAPRDYGIMGITMMTIGYANLMTNFGFNEAIIQKAIVSKKLINSIFTFDVIISVGFAAIFFFGAGYISRFFNSPECVYTIRVLSTLFLATTFRNMAESILKRDMRFKAIATMDVSRNILSAIVTLVLAMNHFQYWSLVYGQLVPIIIVTIAFCARAKWFPMITYSHHSMKRVYDFGLWNFLKGQFNFLIDHVDKMVIGRFLGPVSLGLYDKSMSIAVIPNDSLIMNINSVMFSSFSRNKECGTTLQQQFTKALTLLSIANFPMYTGLIAVAPYFVYGLLGEKWAPMIVPFQILLFGFLFKSFTGLVASLNVGIGRYRGHTLRLILCLLNFAVMCLVFVNFGLNGIAVSFVIFSFTVFIFTIPLGMSKTMMCWKDVMAAILPGVRGSLVMVSTVMVFSHCYATERSVVNLFILSGIGAVAYFVYLLVEWNESVREMRRVLVNDIKEKVSMVF